jgi:very-short-patch-repair endonuclease
MDVFLVAIAALLALALLAGAALLVARRRRAEPDEDGPWPYYPRQPLSEPEQVLYHRMEKALPECMVLAQVQLSRLLGVTKGHSFAVWNNKVSQKSVDFAVCLKDSTLVAVVELDDGTHGRPARRRADADKDKALADAGVAVIRWQAADLPDEQQIREAFLR